jgi:gluconokinase
MAAILPEDRARLSRQRRHARAHAYNGRPMVIAIDVGTSSTRAALYDDLGHPVDGRAHRVAYEPSVTPDGGAEHDPDVLLRAVVECLDAVLGGDGPDVAGVSVCTFWHGLLGFDRSDRPVTPVLLWSDTRGADDAERLRAAVDERAFHARTGCPIHPSYWPAKLRWLARQRAGEVARVSRWGSVGELLELTFFGEAATSVSMASGTGLFDQDRVDWDAEVLAVAGLERERLFRIADRRDGQRGLRAPWASRWPSLRTAIWFPAVGDGATSNVGSGCVDATRIAINVGTSAAMRVLGSPARVAPQGLWRYRLDRDTPMVGGATSEGGNVYMWCQETLRLPLEPDLHAALAALEPDSHGLTVLPFFAGERAPGWRPASRATITGLGLHTTPLDLLHALLEAVALRLALVYELLAPCAAPRHEVVASGGALDRLPAWAQMIADAIGRPVTRIAEVEMTARGAALLALDALGTLGGLGRIPSPAGATHEPDRTRHARYRDALARQRALYVRV